MMETSVRNARTIHGRYKENLNHTCTLAFASGPLKHNPAQVDVSNKDDCFDDQFNVYIFIRIIYTVLSPKSSHVLANAVHCFLDRLETSSSIPMSC